ncbi:hypothetical protein [Nonomuraea basaltis]|uniref:hypothetical protein n=1 Tax=Nonomuraea basaltis TaxID=2495887 RepID=UPI00110C4E58|nr:hypothetical protein [Nonomuraea basaltis]TMR98833.1 hypothetical protein EJK15_10995 [Nonomuraea basaltis]
MSAVTDAKPPGHLRPARMEQVAGGSGTGRDTAGGAAVGAGEPGTAAGGAATGAGGAAATPRRAGAATGVGTAGAKPRGAHARVNPAAELGFSGDPGQHGDPGDGMLHAQRAWDATLATNRLDDLGVNVERQRVETRGVTATVGLLVDGWPADVRACVQSVIDHTGAKVLAFDLGNIDRAGDVLADFAERYPERITVWHVAEAPHWRGGTATWGESRTKLLRLDESDVHVLMETSVVLRGDALTPLVAAIVDGAVGAGWRGAEPSGGGAHEAGPGKVRALTGELMAVRRSAALGALPEDAHYGRNADLELSLGLRGELVVPPGPLPVERLGAHEVPAGYLDRESRRNYDGVLRMLSAS